MECAPEPPPVPPGGLLGWPRDPVAARNDSWRGGGGCRPGSRLGFAPELRALPTASPLGPPPESAAFWGDSWRVGGSRPGGVLWWPPDPVTFRAASWPGGGGRADGGLGIEPGVLFAAAFSELGEIRIGGDSADGRRNLPTAEFVTSGALATLSSRPSTPPTTASRGVRTAG